MNRCRSPIAGKETLQRHQDLVPHLFAVWGEDLDRLFRQGEGVSTHRSGLVLQSVTGADTEHTTLDLLRLFPGTDPAPRPCPASAGAPCTTEVSEQLGVRESWSILPRGDA